MSKTCTKCGETKPLDEYHRHKSGKHGRRAQCKDCVCEVARENYREKNPSARRYKKQENDLPPGHKRCINCSSVKPLDRFYRKETARDGRMTECKLCSNERSRKWKENNPEKAAKHSRLRERKRKRRGRQGREVNREWHRRYRQENRDYLNAQKRKDRLSKNCATKSLTKKWRHPYTQSEDSFLLSGNGMTVYQKAIYLGRSYNACTSRLHILRSRANH